jgi:predicted CXXCH cytochrome family protein
VRPLLLLLLITAAGCGSRLPAASPAPPSPREVQSNILPADYAGSGACADCHPTAWAKWRQSAMRQMTRLPDKADIKAPFGHAEFHFKDDVALLSEESGERFVRIRSGAGEHAYRVTKVIGGRYREDYAGVEVAAPHPGAAVVGDAHEEKILPLSFVYSTQSFRLKGYSVMSAERPGMRVGAVWNRACVFCHNTNPYLWSILGALAGPGAPGYQGEVVDPLLPSERRFSFAVSDEDALGRALADTVRRFHGQLPDSGDASNRELAIGAIKAMRANLHADDLVEIGIGCESCHGGCREHVDDFAVRPSFVPHSRFLAARPASADGVSRAGWINRTCARCHQVLFSRYPFTWEGGGRRKNPGGSHISSGEARDFLLGGCAREMACTACHDPHALDRRERLDALSTVAGNEVCTTCHDGYRGAEALRAHAHHDPGGAGAVCINCHMPKKNMALGYGLSRYHRIGSPTDLARVEGDRPLECALCHPEKSAATILDEMERFWHKRYRRDVLYRLYGDLRAGVLLRTLAIGKPHEKAVAIEVLGAAPAPTARQALIPISHELTNAYPLVRYYAKQALERITGAPCPVDLNQGDAAIQAQSEAWLKTLLGVTPSPPPVAPPPADDGTRGEEDLD